MLYSFKIQHYFYFICLYLLLKSLWFESNESSLYFDLRKTGREVNRTQIESKMDLRFSELPTWGFTTGMMKLRGGY